MSISRVFPIAVRQTLSAAATFDATIDPDLHEEIETKLGLITEAAALTFEGATVAEAVNDALAAGRDIPSDPGVRDAYFRAELRRLRDSDQLAEIARQRLYKAVVSNIDAIVEAFKPAHDAAGERVAAAHAVITAHGIPNLEDSGIVSAGLDVARANVEAREALAVIHAIDTALRMILTSTGKLNESPVSSVVRMADTGNASADDIRRQGRNLTPWEAVDAGYTISLATPTETNERVARANNLVFERDAIAAERATHMFGKRPSLLPATTK
jgi:hypothetical protein